MNELNVIQVKDLGQVVTGKTPSTKESQYFDGDYQFVTPSDLEYKHYYCRHTDTTVTDAAKSKHQNQFIPKDSIMFTCIGNTIGKCAISSEECLTNQQINSVIPTEKKFSKFIYYLLNQNIAVFRGIGLSGGVATPIINKTDFSSVRLKVPAKGTWEAIGEVLSSYDDLIENNRRRIQLLEESARLLYREWFVHLRFPGHEHVKVVEGVPQGWERTEFGKICFQYKKSINPENVAQDTPYIGLEHIPRRSITLSDWETAEKVESNKFEFEEWDIIFGKIRPYFHKVGFALCKGITSSDAIVIRPYDSNAYHFLLMYVSSDAFVALASQTVKEGSKMPRADWDYLLKHQMVVPDKGLMKEFSEFVEPILVQLKTLAIHNKKLAEARDMLLPRLMNGDIAV